MIILTILGLILILFVSAFVVLVLYQKLSWKFKCIDEIPGPKPVPCIGNIYEMFTTREGAFKNDRLRSKIYYPIYKVTYLYEAYVMITHPEDIEKVLTSMKNIEKSYFYYFLWRWLGKGLLTSTGKKWQQRRKILTPAFHFNILQKFLHIFIKETEDLVEILKSNSHKDSIEILPFISEFTLLSINETAMGHKMSRNESFKKYFKAVETMGQLIMERVLKPFFYIDCLYCLTSDGRQENKLIKFLHSISDQVITEREKNFDHNEVLKAQTDDGGQEIVAKKRLAMLDLLLCAKEDGKIDDGGIREEVNTFMFEGHDTTSIAITYSLLMLANNQKIQEEVFQEIMDILGDATKTPSFTDLQNLNLMERCIKETLRLYPSVMEVSRTLGEDIKTVSGYTIPKTTFVRIMIIDLHRDPKIYPEPEKFNPDRFLPENSKTRHPFSYIPFSGGPRNCIGQKYAMIELKAVLCGILKSFVLQPVTRPEDVKVSLDLVMRPTVPVKIKFIPRSD